jgi:hypothetical protein
MQATQHSTPRHWHITSQAKPPGQCAACDAERKRST